jgi:hypothetical protein
MLMLMFPLFIKYGIAMQNYVVKLKKVSGTISEGVEIDNIHNIRHRHFNGWNVHCPGNEGIISSSKGQRSFQFHKEKKNTNKV